MNKCIVLLIILIGFVIENSFAAHPIATHAEHAMVVTEQKIATQVGIDILKAGGNAIDAAVAVGYALAVVFPCCGNIGGGGFATIHLANGKNIVINFREKAPLAATDSMFLDKNQQVIPDLNTKGYLAVAVPGTVLGLETMLKKYGTMPRQKVMAPAIRLAENGFILTANDIQYFSKLLPNPTNNVAKIFFKANGHSYQPGDRLIQMQLSQSLKLIAKGGARSFYHGKIAKEIVKASELNHGLLTLKDFSTYTIQELSPIYCNYHHYNIISAPPPSSGGTTLCEILNILELYPLNKYGFDNVKSIHYTIEAMRYAFYDRNNQLGDPDFVVNPVSKLISKEYAKQIKIKIDTNGITPSTKLNNQSDQSNNIHTTHYSIIDQYGNAVSVTYTLNAYFGAKVIARTTGFFLNDEMDDFAVKAGGVNKFGLKQGSQNTIAPGKRPLSSMTPTIITKNNQVVMIIGSPGGPRIITSILETFLNRLTYGMDLQSAVNHPRFHHQWMPDTIYCEPNCFSKKLTTGLTKMGYHFTPSETWSAVETIYIDPKTHFIEGANDRRRPTGAAIGY